MPSPQPDEYDAQVRSTKFWAAFWDSFSCRFVTANRRQVQLLEISDVLKLQSPPSMGFQSEVDKLKCAETEYAVIAAHSEEHVLRPSPETDAKEPLYSQNSDLTQHCVSRVDRFKVLTWNACAISFPLSIHPIKFVTGLVLGCWWHDWQCDVPLHVDNDKAEARFARQAEYIRESGADLVLLQEVLSTSMIDSLMVFLSRDFDHTYLKCHPKPAARLLWTGFLMAVAFLQCAALQLPLSALQRGEPGLAWLYFCLRWAILASLLAVRWRTSVPAQFLFGDVAGQLVVLRRKGCRTLAGSTFGASEFEIYDRHFRSEGCESPCNQISSVSTDSWLHVFFNVRARGVLRVTVPVTAAGRTATLTLLNTHMPHNCDNSELLHNLGRRAADLAVEGPVILAGDFNPLPDVLLPHQLDPLLKFGLEPTDGLREEFCTWDLEQALTRENAGTPRTMQLDFIFHLQQRMQAAVDSMNTMNVGVVRDWDKEAQQGSLQSLELKACSTTIVDQDKFFREGAPLSDHYGLISEFQVGWNLSN